MSLIGTLAEIKIADVLRLFATGRKSGLLTVSDGSNQATVRFLKGALVHATASRLIGDEAIIDLFGWKEGQLTFVPEEKAVTANVRRDVDALILEGLKHGERFHKMRGLVPSDRVVFQLAAGPADDSARYPMGAKEWRLLRFLDGVREVGEVVEESDLARGEVLELLLALSEAGFVERVDVLKMLRVQGKGLGRDVAEVDERFDGEWRRVVRFANGVLRIEVRTFAGRGAPVGVAFKPGLGRDIHLPRNVAADFGLKEGDEVSVRPIA